MQQIVTLTAVEEKAKGNNKRGPWALRIFTAAGGTKFQTFDVDLGEQVVGLLNQEIEVSYEVEANGDFTNNVLKSVKVTGNAPSAASVNASSQDEFRRSKEEMRRTESVKAAATIIASPNWNPDNLNLEVLGALAEKIAVLIETGAVTVEAEAVRF